MDDVGAIVICGGARPSHQAVAVFIRRHRAEIRRLFVQVLSLLAAEGAVAGHLAAVDGSPVSANASRFANVTGDQLAERIAAAEAAVSAAAGAWLDGAGGGQAAQRPLRDDDDHDDDDDPLPGGGVPRRLAAQAALLARLRAAQDKLAQRQAAPGRPGARVSARADAVAAVAARLARAEASAAAKVDAYQATVAAGKTWPYGKTPVPAHRSARVAQVARNLATARARLEAACQAAAAASPVKVTGDRSGLPAAAG